MSYHPIIGITADYQEKVNCYSKYPWFALRKHYTSCLERLGCMPIILPPSKNYENIDLGFYNNSDMFWTIVTCSDTDFTYFCICLHMFAYLFNMSKHILKKHADFLIC